MQSNDNLSKILRITSPTKESLRYKSKDICCSRIVRDIYFLCDVLLCCGGLDLAGSRMTSDRPGNFLLLFLKTVYQYLFTFASIFVFA